jgi:hypothetical protein
MKNGCTAHDTIQEVDSTSLKELDSTSSYVVELCWQSEESIDLLFVLSICFTIRNDKWADRYTLQRYNCYFVSWAIITITMRKSAVCSAVLNVGEVPGGVRELELELALWRALQQEQELDQELEPEPERTWELEQDREQELDYARGLEGGLVLEPVRQREPELVRQRVLAWLLASEREREREGERASEREPALVWERASELVQELRRGLVQGLVQEKVWEWAHGLGQIPLVLGFTKNPTLAKPFSSRQVVFYDLVAPWSDFF